MFDRDCLEGVVNGSPSATTCLNSADGLFNIVFTANATQVLNRCLIAFLPSEDELQVNFFCPMLYRFFSLTKLVQYRATKGRKIHSLLKLSIIENALGHFFLLGTYFLVRTY